MILLHSEIMSNTAKFHHSIKKRIYAYVFFMILLNMFI